MLLWNVLFKQPPATGLLWFILQCGTTGDASDTIEISRDFTSELGEKMGKPLNTANCTCAEGAAKKNSHYQVSSNCTTPPQFSEQKRRVLFGNLYIQGFLHQTLIHSVSISASTQVKKSSYNVFFFFFPSNFHTFFWREELQLRMQPEPH